MKFTYPGMPPKQLTGNSRGHWSNQVGAKAGMRERGLCDGRAGDALLTGPVEIRLVVWQEVGSKLYDLLNVEYGMKSYIDGLVDAGVFVDDSPTYLKRVVVEHGGLELTGDGRVEVYIESAE